MKSLNNAKISKSNKNDTFTEMVEAVYLFIHEHYGDFGAILRDYKINYSQYAALITIHMNGNLSEGDLARMLFINPSTVSRMAYALEQQGWLKSVRDSDDRRRVMVSLSATGRRRMEAMRNKQAQIVARRVEELDPETKEYVYRVAEFVNQALRYMISSG